MHHSFSFKFVIFPRKENVMLEKTTKNILWDFFLNVYLEYQGTLMYKLHFISILSFIVVFLTKHVDVSISSLQK